MLCGARSGSGGVNAKYHTKVRNFSEYDKFLLSAHIIIIKQSLRKARIAEKIPAIRAYSHKKF